MITLTPQSLQARIRQPGSFLNAFHGPGRWFPALSQSETSFFVYVAPGLSSILASKQPLHFSLRWRRKVNDGLRVANGIPLVDFVVNEVGDLGLQRRHDRLRCQLKRHGDSRK